VAVLSSAGGVGGNGEVGVAKGIFESGRILLED